MQAEADISSEAQEALYSLAYICYNQGKYGEATALFRTLTVENPRGRKFWMGLGASLQMVKNYNEALLAYEVAAMLQPLDPHVHLYAADCFFTQGLAKEGLFALECAERALKSWPAEKQSNYRTHISLLRQAWRRKK